MSVSITRHLVGARLYEPALGQAKITKCSECKKKFERLSEKWAYYFRKGNKDYWQCSWKCHRAAETRLFPPKPLRGQHCAEKRIADGREND